MTELQDTAARHRLAQPAAAGRRAGHPASALRRRAGWWLVRRGLSLAVGRTAGNTTLRPIAGAR